MRGCHSPGSGRITAAGSKSPQSTRIAHRKLRPTSNVDFDDAVAGEARRDRLPKLLAQSAAYVGCDGNAVGTAWKTRLWARQWGMPPRPQHRRDRRCPGSLMTHCELASNRDPVGFPITPFVRITARSGPNRRRPSWWGSWRSRACNLPGPGKNRRNHCKDLLAERSSATSARVTFEDSIYCFARTEFFSVLLEADGCSAERPFWVATGP